MKTILHVEDDPLIVHIYGTALKRAGFQVEVAEDGVLAAKMLFKSRPDLVVHSFHAGPANPAGGHSLEREHRRFGR